MERIALLLFCLGAFCFFTLFIIKFLRWRPATLAAEAENFLLYAGLFLSAATTALLLYYLFVRF